MSVIKYEATLNFADMADDDLIFIRDTSDGNKVHALTKAQLVAGIQVLVDALEATLGTAAVEDVGAFATAAQGATADTAVQPNDDPTFGNITVTGTVDGRDVAADGTKLDTVETNADVTDAANVDAAGAVMNGDTSTASMSFVVDEDDMVSDSATKIPTQQSVKAYVDTEIAGVGGGAEVLETQVFS